MGKTLKGEKTSFWQVIQGNTIVIPQIQRDYAQGRKDKAVIEIRDRIIDRFYHAINNPEQPLDIDFVYGYNSRNEFIPLDGQQRLTTLFLIHWYISKRRGIGEERLGHFRYETRQSSTDFCKKLFEIDIPFKDLENIKDWIKDQRWFFHSWQKDPTIKAMLIMMQSIHEKFKGGDFIQLWKNIVEQNPITFNFLSIKNTGLTDELYIKMNSRGKPLTRFENFKVWFEKKYPENIDWKNKIDNDWTNLFWKYKDAFKTKNSLDTAIDDEFMQFINGMCMFSLGQNGKEEEVHYFANNSDISLSEYEKLNLFSEGEVVRISQTLDWFSTNDNNSKEILEGIDFWSKKTILEAFISSNPTYPDSVRFYSVVHYITYTVGKEFDKDSFRQWMRVTRNLVENTAIDSSERFIDAIKAIDAIKDDCTDIIGYLQLQPKISFFLQSQVEEEKKKAELVGVDDNWLVALINAENHELFRGSIAFLLSGNIGIENFIQYRNIAMSLFDKDGSKYKNNYTLVRATLAFWDVSENIRLLDNGANWRILLKRKDIQSAILKVIYRLDATGEYLNELNAIIEEYKSGIVLWVYYLVKNPILLCDSTHSRLIKEYWGPYYLYNKETWIHNKNQILLSNRRNEIVTLFIEKLKLNIENWRVIFDKTTKQSFYRGKTVWLKKEISSYGLQFHFEVDYLVVGFHVEDKDTVDIAENEFDKNSTWLVFKNFGRYPNAKEEIEEWVERVICEIPVIENLAKAKQE
jgi:Protein of unknown function DUF262